MNVNFRGIPFTCFHVGEELIYEFSIFVYRFYRSNFTRNLQVFRLSYVYLVVNVVECTVPVQYSPIQPTNHMSTVRRKHEQTGTRPNDSIVNEDEKGKALTFTVNGY